MSNEHPPVGGSEHLLSFVESQALATTISILQEEERRVGSRRNNPGGKPQRYVLDDEGRALLQAHYDSRSETITWLCQELGKQGEPFPRQIVKKWAAALGLTAPKDPPWSEEDIHFLRNSARSMGIKTLAKQLGRTETAVKLKAKRLGIRHFITGSGYSLRAVCLGLGVDHHKVEEWLRLGWLQGICRENSQIDGHDLWAFSEEAIRLLAREHPDVLDLRRVDRAWFLKVLLGAPSPHDLPIPLDTSRYQRTPLLSDQAHSLLVAYYTGDATRTESLADILGVLPQDITAWAILLKLERPTRVVHHSQPPLTKEKPQRDRVLRRALEARYTGDPGATQALADDFALDVQDIEEMAQSMGFVQPQPRSQKHIPLSLAAHVWLANEYHDGMDMEQAIQTLTALLVQPITAKEIHHLAGKLGLRSKYRRPGRPVLETGENQKHGSVLVEPLRLATAEWQRFLPASLFQHLAHSEASSPLSTVEELRLGHCIACKRKTPGDYMAHTLARQAHTRLVSACFPVIFHQALLSVGRGVSLEILVQAGYDALAQNIWQFDYLKSHPLISCVLPVVKDVLLQHITAASATKLVSRRTPIMSTYKIIASTSVDLAHAAGSAPTLVQIATALSFSLAQIVETIQEVLQTS